MCEKGLISVIIPVYNVEKYLRQCLESLVKQTYARLEFICINDGSQDNSLEILYEYAQVDGRIRIINQDNRGQGVARNRGIKAARGEYIAFVDADDFVELDLFEKCLAKASDVIVFGVKTFYENNGRVRQGQYSSKHFRQSGLFEFHTISCNKLYRKQFLDENNISFAALKTGEEQLFFLKCMLLAENISVVNEDLYFYRKNRTGSLTSAKKRLDFSPVENFYMIENFLEHSQIDSELQLKILGHYMLKAISWYPKIDVSIRSKYYAQLEAALEFLKQKNGRYWWDYFTLRNKHSYICLKLEYFKSLIFYFVCEKLFYIPAALCFFMWVIIGDDE
ncbi:MAG: glycosyltransferase [Fusobacterium sp.]|nr:glycosyltransferase [Fusobacterium sp.]